MALSWVVSVPRSPAVVWILHESGLPPTGTRTYGLEATFLCYCSELSRSKASSQCRPLHGLSYPWASGGNTIDISAWRCLSRAMSLLGDVSLGRCLSWAMSLLGDASLGRCLSCAMSLLGDVSLGWCLSWAMPLLGDVRPPDLPLSNTSMTHKGRQPIMYAAERHFHKRRLCTPRNATSINGDYVDFLTTHLSVVHVITPDDLIGTQAPQSWADNLFQQKD